MCEYENKANHPTSSNIHPSETAHKAIHILKIRGCVYKTNGNIHVINFDKV